MRTLSISLAGLGALALTACAQVTSDGSSIGQDQAFKKAYAICNIGMEYAKLNMNQLNAQIRENGGKVGVKTNLNQAITSQAADIIKSLDGAEAKEARKEFESIRECMANQYDKLRPKKKMKHELVDACVQDIQDRFRQRAVSKYGVRREVILPDHPANDANTIVIGYALHDGARIESTQKAKCHIKNGKYNYVDFI